MKRGRQCRKTSIKGPAPGRFKKPSGPSWTLTAKVLVRAQLRRSSRHVRLPRGRPIPGANKGLAFKAHAHSPLLQNFLMPTREISLRGTTLAALPFPGALPQGLCLNDAGRAFGCGEQKAPCKRSMSLFLDIILGIIAPTKGEGVDALLRRHGPTLPRVVVSMAADSSGSLPVQVTSGGEIDESGQNEVMEFPWVVLDVESKQIMDEQKLVVRDRKITTAHAQE